MKRLVAVAAGGYVAAALLSRYQERVGRLRLEDGDVADVAVPALEARPDEVVGAGQDQVRRGAEAGAVEPVGGLRVERLSNMRFETLAILRCPYCGGRLELVTSSYHRQDDDEIYEDDTNDLYVTVK